MSLRSRLSKTLAPAAVVAAALALPGVASATTASDFPLRAWWPLAEGKGQTISDWSGRGHNGFLGETPSPDSHDPSWVKGIFYGSALHFDGVDDYAQVPDTPDLHPQQL